MQTAGSFLTFGGSTSGSGNRTIDIVVDANTTTVARTTQITAGGRTATLSQVAASASPTPTPPPTPPPGASPTPLPTPGSTTVSRFDFTSAAGDFLGNGQTGSFSAPGTQFLIQDLSSVTTVNVTVGAGSNRWDALFSAPTGQTLVPGVYENAMRSPFNGPSPGLSITSPRGGCNQVTGRFAVHVLERSSSGAVRKFHATFVHYCDGSTAPLTGEVVYIAPVGTLPAPHLLSSQSGFRFVSNPGDWVGGGATRQFTTSDATFSGVTDEGGRVVRLSVAASNGQHWSVGLSATSGRVLAPGVYADATRSGMQSGATPGLDVGGDGRGCNVTTGLFQIHAMEFGPLQSLRKVHATFEQHCENLVPGLKGEIVVIVSPSPTTLPPPTPSPSSSFLKFVSEPGDYVGAGQTQNWPSSSATFTVSDLAYGVEATLTPNGEPNWRWKLAMAVNRLPPSPGLYELAPAYSITNVGPGFTFFGEGRACSDEHTTFQVHEISRAAGEITRLQVTFEQRCAIDRPALRGELVYIRP